LSWLLLTFFELELEDWDDEVPLFFDCSSSLKVGCGGFCTCVAVVVEELLPLDDDNEVDADVPVDPAADPEDELLVVPTLVLPGTEADF